MTSAMQGCGAGMRNNTAYNPVNISFLGQQKLTDGSLRCRIHVYQPTYPSQAFPERPLHILDSEPTTTCNGLIEPRYPHAINSITIGDLGVEEVLVSAHDDGDVCVWYTRDLTRIALRRNVGISAWGVALHKGKRLLAVSANSHLIHVFHLGIGDKEHKAERARRTASNDMEMGGNGTINERPDEPQWSTNPVKILEGHGHNIPSISFLDDASGNWLVGTSIDGMVIVWDIEKEEKAKETKLSNSDRRRGWSVLFLQLECFLPTRNEFEGLGRDVIRKTKTEGAYDISPFVSSGDSDWGTGSEDDESDDGAETEDYDDEDEDDFVDSIEPDYPIYEASEVESSLDQSMDEAGDDDEDSWVDNDSMWEASRGLQNRDSRDWTQNNADAMTALALVRSTVEPTESEPRFNRPGRNPPIVTQHSEFQSLPTPPSPQATVPQALIFSTSEDNIRLLDVPNLKDFSKTSLKNVVICQHALHSFPALFSRYQYLGNINRLNMVCHIPELSMVVTANQQGKAAVFRLTQDGDGYMMRLDEILPRERNDGIKRVNPITQDEPVVQPCAALLGIAVGPIQGREFGRSRRNSDDKITGGLDSDGIDQEWLDPDEARTRTKRGVWRGLERRRRYRLMMVYIDGSILSYELGGTPDSELSSCTVDGGYLMV
ncbi:hypothetical protein L211DRAFT_848235 [Terfezia boudieri ATCC MYA-4762]|uniref:Uncharacterized protein n=1 Tax=Terfezia boudieri ATCC MYA-4762 TaxID=1051890 RepID=A0A3N4LW37_9PEZI|nr:hypothetical protein L211DRAFT_848235 [Terfezia boudieri ATCC MYA-4762]